MNASHLMAGSPWQRLARDWRSWAVLIIVAWPAIDLALPTDLRIGALLPNILAFAFLALGIHVVTGATGLLHLGAAAFVAIGAFAFAISTTTAFPFQLGFWPGLGVAIAAGTSAGVLLGLPTTRLRGDYLAIATLGFGEIVVDLLKNLDVITKGTQTLGDLPKPWLGVTLPNIVSTANAWIWWHWLYLAFIAVAVWLLHNLQNSQIGRAWIAVREDELAARAMGIPVARVKLGAFTLGSALCATGGALYACLLGNSSDPTNYDFMLSVMGISMVILGGMGSLTGALVGAMVIGGFNVIILDKMTRWLGETDSMLLSLSNWQYLIFGLMLVLMMRFRPAGVVPERRTARGSQ